MQVNKKYQELIKTLVLVVIGILISIVIMNLLDKLQPEKKTQAPIREGGYKIAKGIYYE